MGALTRLAHEEVIDARGGALLPALADHHIHLLALAARSASIICGPPEINNETDLAHLLKQHSEGNTWIRGVAYHESVAGIIDRHWLDQHLPDRPVRIQHRGGRLWIINSKGLETLKPGSNERLPPGMSWDKGQLYDEDQWLRQRLAASPPDLSQTSHDLARLGVSLVTDMTPQNDQFIVNYLSSQQQQHKLLQDIVVAGRPSLSRLEQPLHGNRLKIGPTKIHLHEARLPDFDQTCRLIIESHSESRPVAFHCVTEIELVFALAAISEAGPIKGDRIEHASIAPSNLLKSLSELGLIVVTQPNFILERGAQYLSDISLDDIPALYRCRGFLDYGIELAGGTDAPFGSANPWLAMHAAVNRQSDDSRIINFPEALTPEQAISLFLGELDNPGKQRKLETGGLAHMCLLNSNWRKARQNLTCNQVIATWRAGVLIHNSIN
jgi:predicted amidohydrolase YtcJ